MTPSEASFSEEPDLNLEWGPVRIIPTYAHDILTSIREDETSALMDLASDKDVLEVGGAHGYSAIVMALAGAKKVISIDDHNGFTQLGNTLSIMTNNLNLFGVQDKVEIVIANAKTGMLHLIEAGQDFDFVFLDGGQEYEQLCSDLALGLALIAFRNGTIAIHDYGHPDYPDKKKAVDKYFPGGPDKLVTTLFIKHL